MNYDYCASRWHNHLYAISIQPRLRKALLYLLGKGVRESKLKFKNQSIENKFIKKKLIYWKINLLKNQLVDKKKFYWGRERKNVNFEKKKIWKLIYWKINLLGKKKKFNFEKKKKKFKKKLLENKFIEKLITLTLEKKKKKK